MWRNGVRGCEEGCAKTKTPARDREGGGWSGGGGCHCLDALPFAVWTYVVCLHSSKFWCSSPSRTKHESSWIAFFPRAHCGQREREVTTKARVPLPTLGWGGGLCERAHNSYSAPSGCGHACLCPDLAHVRSVAMCTPLPTALSLLCGHACVLE